MSRLLRPLFALALSLTLATFAAANDAIQWAPNLQAAVETAARNNQLVLIHFWTPTCPPCRALERNVFSRADVAEAIHRDYVPVKVNAEANPEIADRYKVDRWPMDVIVTPAGYKVHSMVSPQDPNEYMGTIGKLAADRRPGATLANNAPRPEAEALAQRQFQEPPQAQPQQSRFSQFASQQQDQQPPQGQQFTSAPRPKRRLVASMRTRTRKQQQQPTNNFAGRPPYDGGAQQQQPQQPDPRVAMNNAPPAAPTQPQRTTNPYINQGPPQGGPQADANASGSAAPPAANKPPMGLDGYCPLDSKSFR